jgi:hypothetical protein
LAALQAATARRFIVSLPHRSGKGESAFAAELSLQSGSKKLQKIAKPRERPNLEIAHPFGRVTEGENMVEAASAGVVRLGGFYLAGAAAVCCVITRMTRQAFCGLTRSPLM